jgi:hypothetical protein
MAADRLQHVEQVARRLQHAAQNQRAHDTHPRAHEPAGESSDYRRKESDQLGNRRDLGQRKAERDV